MNLERPLTVVISATKALEKWLGREIPRMPGPNGRRIGTQPLVTDSNTVSWQCHVLENTHGSGLYTAIAVEAHSRYTILLPFHNRPALEEFWAALERAWGEQLVHLMCKGGLIEETQVKEVFHLFLHSPLEVNWYRNTDLSVNGHVADAEQWVKQTCEQRGVDRLDKEQAFGLGLHINEMFKRAKGAHGVQETFYPIPRFLADGLYRFARGLAKPGLSGALEGDCRNPYSSGEVIDTGKQKENKPAMQTSNTDEDLGFIDAVFEKYGSDKSITSVSELDGFLTAIVSGPDMILPSEWLPALWGGEQQAPVWESQAEASRFIQIAMGLMNDNAHTLVEQPQDFSAMFLEDKVEGKPVEIVRFWCYGYMRAVAMRPGSWVDLPEDIQQHLGRIAMFGSPEGEAALEQLPEEAVLGLQAKVEPAARAIHAHWLAQRAHLRPGVPTTSAKVVPFVREVPRVGRNEPCPCGSGKKYKQCCLH